jgi:hypothetical protein
MKACQAGEANDFVKQRQKMSTYVFTGYNADIRPESVVTGNFTFILQQLIDVNEVTQIMTSSINVIMTWTGINSRNFSSSNLNFHSPAMPNLIKFLR